MLQYWFYTQKDCGLMGYFRDENYFLVVSRKAKLFGMYMVVSCCFDEFQGGLESISD